MYDYTGGKEKKYLIFTLKYSSIKQTTGRVGRKPLPIYEIKEGSNFIPLYGELRELLDVKQTNQSQLWNIQFLLVVGKFYLLKSYSVVDKVYGRNLGNSILDWRVGLNHYEKFIPLHVELRPFSPRDHQVTVTDDDNLMLQTSFDLGINVLCLSFQNCSLRTLKA